ncbi:hypothetical protein VSDG_02949 [Cytospora chrysosperma]|uniref:Uncharacterized protein n=1 Tax=Cytospora chrysosperma TaxID=252740 RepID=A0A423W8R1_CYTCH|nr:hypothetical protein VSDG_02949 [Valsa sordida]
MSPLSTLPVRVARARTNTRLFSTTRPLLSGSFFNLGALGASREAQYLSKEHGIPRAEYSSSIHLIRSSEVDPFAPAPGAAPSLAAVRAAQAATRPGPKATQETTPDGLVFQLEAVAEQLAQTKTALEHLQARNKGLDIAVILVPILSSIIAFIGYQIYCETEEEHAGPLQSLPNPLGVHTQQPISQTHGSTKPSRDATVEAHALAESGLISASSETRAKPADPSTDGTVFTRIFWASK